MRISDSEISCGVRELVDLGEQTGITDKRKRTTLKKFAKMFNLDKPSPAEPADVGDYRAWDKYYDQLDDLKDTLERGYTYLFSDNEQNGNGQQYCEWIRKYKLGKVTAHGWHVNPNTGRKINVWVWTWNGKSIPKSEYTNVKVGTKKTGSTERASLVGRHARNG